jgi:hypothetical protein
MIKRGKAEKIGSFFKQLFVKIVAPDPKPSQTFRSFFGQRPMAQTDASRPKYADFLESKRRVALVRF